MTFGLLAPRKLRKETASLDFWLKDIAGGRPSDGPRSRSVTRLNLISTINASQGTANRTAGVPFFFSTATLRISSD